MGKFFGHWSNEADVAREFADDAVLDYNIIVAGYFYECYEGNAYVLAEKDGKLFEVSGGHCSCYGLEGQWEPGEITPAYLRNRAAKGSFCHGEDSESVLAAIKEYLDNIQ